MREARIGRDNHLNRIIGTILEENSAMQHTAVKAGFTLLHASGDIEYEALLLLKPRR
jgi:hypothetical protein